MRAGDRGCAARSLLVAVLPAALITASVVPTACSDEAAVRGIESTREVNGAGPVPDLSSGDRFGFRDMPAAAPAAGSTSLAWDLPAGWTERAPAPPRAGSFALPGGVECSITELPGNAGGLSANVNRWRSQLGLPPGSEAEMAAWPRRPMLGGQAVRVELSGDEGGADSGGAERGTAMIGWILEESGRTVFVKAVGPAAALASQRGALDDLVASLRRRHDHAAHAAADDPHAGLVVAAEGDPHAGLDPATLDSMAVVMGAGAGGEAGGLHWTAPHGWERSGERPMRLVTFSPADRPDVECYVVVLGGGGGTVTDNVNRWRGQLGLGPQPPAEVEALPSLEVLGARSTLVDLVGDGPAEGRSLLGLICPLPGQGVFVKLTGPTDAVAAERERFVSFVRSLAF